MKRRSDYAPRKQRRRNGNAPPWESPNTKPCPKCGNPVVVQQAAEGSFLCCAKCGYTRKHPGQGSP